MTRAPPLIPRRLTCLLVWSLFLPFQVRRERHDDAVNNLSNDMLGVPAWQTPATLSPKQLECYKEIRTWMTRPPSNLNETIPTTQQTHCLADPRMIKHLVPVFRTM